MYFSRWVHCIERSSVGTKLARPETVGGLSADALNTPLVLLQEFVYPFL
jgi:hypothetical protein